ncbi:MAG TPA: acyl-CoA carboxylase subunit beta [Methylocella sp.]|nr:acyl-CoA carboxylase subunit beta [Methylocella sp.]
MEALAGGAQGAIAAQHAAGKLTARERIEILTDAGSFEEFGLFVKPRASHLGADQKPGPAEGVVTGWGMVNGRKIFVFAKDYTVLGGSLSEAHALKIARLQEMALHNKAPLIGLYDSAGLRVQEGLAALAGLADVLQRHVSLSGVVPQISLILGPCVGADSLAPALGDFTFMVKDTSVMFVTGPDVVREVRDEHVSAEELGGAAVHTTQSGLADGAYENEIEALRQMRRLIDFLPASNQDEVPSWPSFDDAGRCEASLDRLAPADSAKPYDMKELIAKTVDEGDFFEIQAAHARNIIIGFGRLDGRVVGFVANQPLVLAGTLDADASRKAARFVRFCDGFHIPIVTFVDVPGFLPGTGQEHGGLIKEAAKLLYAYAEASVPKVTLITRKAFGGAYAVMASKPLRGDISYAWPGARIGLMSAKSAVEILYEGETQEAEKIAERMRDYEERCLSPYAAAEGFHIDDVIFPRETRPRLIRALSLLHGKRRPNPWKKHGNIPL